jgi:hypothetical protein
VAESAPSRHARLADRLAVAPSFVGRAAELELLRAALAAQPPPFAVLHLYGPGGVGKSSLLRQYRGLARQAGRLVVWLDGRDLEASPPGFLQALNQELGLSEAASAPEALAQHADPVLLLDTYERLAPLDGWLRETLLPRLPAGALVVIAGRHPPSAAWREDEAWRELTRIVSLRNLRPEESAAYLAERGVPPAQHPAVLGFTYGHPLALTLVAEVIAQAVREGRDAAFQPEQAPDVVAALLERFIQQAPSAQHRLALHACATARVLTEPLLRAALGQDDVHALFAWLRGLTFVEAGPFGLYPHDLAREVLDSDLRWRDPDGYQALHARIRDGILRQVREAQGSAQLRAMFDFVYLHRHNPVLQPYYLWQEFGTHYTEAARPADHGAVLRRLAQLGDASAVALAEYWLARQPAAWHVIRDPRGELAGVFAYLALHPTSPVDRQRDPVVAAAWEHMQRQAPLRPGDEATLGRIYTDRAAHPRASPAANTAQLAAAIRWLTQPRLAWSFVETLDPDYWHGLMSYIDFQRVDGAPIGLYAHDWRAVPVAQWIDMLGSRELATELRVEDLAAAPTAPLLVLSQPEFEAAVKDALRDFHSAASLAANPLTRSRLVANASDGEPASAALQRLLRSGAESLRQNPKEEKFYRALAAAYFTPAATHEQAAERLDLPFNTYRYQLARGMARLTEWLWRRELSGPDA